MIRRTCEEAVDETVLVALGGQAKNYSNTLIDISEMAFWKADFGLRLIGVAESRKASTREDQTHVDQTNSQEHENRRARRERDPGDRRSPAAYGPRDGTGAARDLQPDGPSPDRKTTANCPT